MLTENPQVVHREQEMAKVSGTYRALCPCLPLLSSKLGLLDRFIFLIRITRCRVIVTEGMKCCRADEACAQLCLLQVKLFSYVRVHAHASLLAVFNHDLSLTEHFPHHRGISCFSAYAVSAILMHPGVSSPQRHFG